MALIIIRYIECFLTLGFAGLLFEFSFVKDIKSDLKQFNKIAKNKKSKSPIIEEQLVKLINFDVNLRELSLSRLTNPNWWSIVQFWIFSVFFRLPEHIVEVYSITLVVLFIGCTSTICLSLLMIQVELTQVFINYRKFFCFASEINGEQSLIFTVFSMFRYKASQCYFRQCFLAFYQ